MNTITHYDMQDELKKRGFHFLTSEADALGLRILVDLTRSAADALARFMGGTIPHSPNYNSGAVRSCFLPRSNEFYTALLIFLLFEEDNTRVILECEARDEYKRDVQACIRVLSADEYERAQSDETAGNLPSLARIRELYNFRLHILGSAPRRGLSNVHAFTGRSQ